MDTTDKDMFGDEHHRNSIRFSEMMKNSDDDCDMKFGGDGDEAEYVLDVLDQLFAQLDADAEVATKKVRDPSPLISFARKMRNHTDHKTRKLAEDVIKAWEGKQ
jgi:hypothetical protein